MNATPSYNKQSDPPLSLAILVAALFIGLLFYKEIAALRLPPWGAVERYLNDHPVFSVSFAVALAFDLLAGGSLIYGVLAGKRQGKNLEALSGTRRDKVKIGFTGFAISVALGAGVFAVLQYFFVPGLVGEMPGYWDPELERLAVHIVASTYAIACLVGCALVCRLAASLGTRGTSKLPPYPAAKNSIVLGSVSEEVVDA